MNLKTRISRLEQAVKNAGGQRENTYPEECICFPEDEPPCLQWRAEVEAAAAVLCPLHGQRFDHVETRGLYTGVYRALWFRGNDFTGEGWPPRSKQYKKAIRSSFSPDRWPQVEERGGWPVASTILILRDRTELPAGGRAEEWRP